MDSAMQKWRADGGGKSNVLSAAKFALMALVVAICYAALRFSCCMEWKGATLDAIYRFKAPIPFGKRLLTVWLAHGLTGLGCPMVRAFESLEIFGAFALALGLQRVFRIYLPEMASKILALLYFAVLPPMYLLRLPLTIFYPWDTWAMALTAWGIFGLLNRRWKMTVAVMVLASLNRESAVLLPLLFVGMYADRRPWWKVAGYTALLTGIYVVCQWIIGTTLADNDPMFGKLWFGMSVVAEEYDGMPYRVALNWQWLTGAWERLFILAGLMSGVPLLYAGVFKRLPPWGRWHGIVAEWYIAMLAVIANLNEPREFGEAMVILFIPAVLGIYEVASGRKVFKRDELGGGENGLATWMGWIEGICAAGICLTLAIVGWLLSHW